MNLFSSFFVVATVAIVSCKKEVTPASSNNFHIRFNFSHNIDGADVELNTIKYLNNAGNLYSISDLRYFICNVSLHKGNDSVLFDEAHYIDIADILTCTYLPTQKVDNGNYDYISLVLGLDVSKNITNKFVNPPESNMEWPIPMGGGYHYLQLQGKFDSSGVIKNYAIHTGALNKVPLFIPIRLSQSAFTSNGKDITVNLEMNVNEWFENPNTYNLNIYGDDIMANVGAQKVLQQNGADVFTVNSIK